MANSKILTLIQARSSSSRLPGKVLLDLCGKPMIERLVERVRRSRLLGAIMVVTSDQPSDDPLARFCERSAIPVFRGSLEDVLDRFYQAAATSDADHIMRLTGDCPLIDPGVLDLLVEFYRSGTFDYASNTLKPTYPDGLDAEIFTRKSLEEAWLKAELQSEREHVTPYLKKSTNLRKGNLEHPVDLSDLRWTVDEAKDLELVRRIYSEFIPGLPDFRMDEILALLDRHPELRTLNSQYERDEGYRRSLANDTKLR